MSFALPLTTTVFPFQNDNECEENRKKKFLHSSWDFKLAHTLLNLLFTSAENNQRSK